MLLETFNKLCSELGDQSYDEPERWKSIRSISTEGQMEPIDFEFRFSNNEAYFISDSAYGSGFIFIETPYAEFEPINNILINGNIEHRRILTFIGLENVNGLSFKTKSITNANSTIDNIGGE